MHLKRARVEFSASEIPASFIVGPDRVAVVYLSLAWELKFPGFFKENRILKNAILLLQRDTESGEEISRSIQVTAFGNDMRVLVAYSADEAARILEILHFYGKDRAEEVVRGGSTAAQISARFKDVLGVIKGVNSSDVIQLLAKFKSLKAISNATESQLLEVPSIGEKKAKAIWRCFNDSF